MVQNSSLENDFILSKDLSLVVSERSPLSEDYTLALSGLGEKCKKLEEEITHVLDKWFKIHNLVDYGTAIIVDEESVLIRVDYTF